jgi:hypothetical protein
LNPLQAFEGARRHETRREADPCAGTPLALSDAEIILRKARQVAEAVNGIGR